ncbi:hypothetical protein PLESTM_001383200 [Pleodorina starrii]|nr:hypothetical protein PLESTM_001383200 [Pleodorina starrii]
MGLIHWDIKPANILAGTSGYRGHEEDVMTETHGHAFDVYSMGACMLYIPDGSGGVLRSWPADPPSQAKKERLVAAAQEWHYSGTAAPADRQACRRLREHAAGGGGGAVGDGGGGGGSVGFSGRDVFPELGGGDALTQATPWIRICAAHSAAAGGGILRTTASDGAAGSASTALPPLTDSTALPPPPPLAAASPAAPRSRSGLGPAAKAALVLMLQCQEDTAARAALAGSPDCTAAEMLQAPQLHSMAALPPGRRYSFSSAFLRSTNTAAAESPAPVPGALLAATRCQDAHAAKAVAMALHNVLVSEGGAAAVETQPSRLALELEARRVEDIACYPHSRLPAPPPLTLRLGDAPPVRVAAGQGGSAPVPAKSSDK